MESDTPILTSAAPIPVRGTIIAAVRMVMAEWKNILHIIAVPSLILALIALALRVTMGEANQPGVNLVHGMISIFVQPWLAISLIRYLVLSEKPAGFIPPYQKRMWSYMWRQFLVTMATCVPIFAASVLLYSILPQHFATVVVTVVAVAFIIAATRLSLVVPATAIGTDNKLISSWRRTEGQLLRIMMIRIALAVMVMLPVFVVVIVAMVIGAISPHLAFFVSLWGVTILQIAAMQIIDALVYAHFCRGELPRHG